MESIGLVGLAKFELATPWPPDRASTDLGRELLVAGVHGWPL